MNDLDISIVILTYNRPDMLEKNLRGVCALVGEVCEIIVVDNSSDDATDKMIRQNFPEIKYIHNEVNEGVAGRNKGLRVANGDIVITLDDDVLELGKDDIANIQRQFHAQPRLGALCFRVLHFETGEICNWCHHREHERDGLGEFLTYEISEGAVAYRRAAVEVAGPYFEGFFMSHEGKDMAYRLMNHVYRVAYDGRISVVHYHALSGRANWRRYYYDTRNSIWLAVRNMPLGYGFRFLVIALLTMMVYSIRDGFFQYWLKAIWDGTRNVPEIKNGRTPWSENTRDQVKGIDRRRPSFWYKAKLRLFRKKVEI